MELTKRFCDWIYLFFISSYSDGITMTKKPIGYWRFYHSGCQLPRSHGVWRPHHELYRTYTSNSVQYSSGFYMNINDATRPQHITLYDS